MLRRPKHRPLLLRRDFDGRTAIHHCILSGSKDDLRRWIRDATTLPPSLYLKTIDAQDRWGETPLYLAISYNKHAYVELLIRAGSQGLPLEQIWELRQGIFFRESLLTRLLTAIVY